MWLEIGLIHLGSYCAPENLHSKRAYQKLKSFTFLLN